MPLRALALRALVPVLLGACSVRPQPGPITSPAPVSPTRAAAAPELDASLLLLLEDRRIYEPLVVSRALAGPPEIRERLAVALGRIGDPQGRPILEILLADATVETRRAAAFALGELGAPAAREALRQ